MESKGLIYMHHVNLNVNNVLHVGSLETLCYTGSQSVLDGPQMALMGPLGPVTLRVYKWHPMDPYGSI